jgi:hypothetical protein
MVYVKRECSGNVVSICLACCPRTQGLVTHLPAAWQRQINMLPRHQIRHPLVGDGTENMSAAAFLLRDVTAVAERYLLRHCLATIV